MGAFIRSSETQPSTLCFYIIPPSPNHTILFLDFYLHIFMSINRSLYLHRSTPVIFPQCQVPQSSPPQTRRPPPCRCRPRRRRSSSARCSTDPRGTATLPKSRSRARQRMGGSSRPGAIPSLTISRMSASTANSTWRRLSASLLTVGSTRVLPVTFLFVTPS